MEKIEFRVLKEVRCVHAIGTGDITIEYLIKRIKDIHNHPEFELFFNHYIDFENAVISFKDKDFGAYKFFFKELQKTNISRKWAIYTKNEITFQTANMHHLILTSVIEVKVFQIREMALEFLGITEKDLYVH